MERGGDSRQTRSQAAPDWSLEECLTLVNEINSVENEWQHTLASFQIWQLVVQNCNALHVNNRSLNQCKTKWDALLADFNNRKSSSSPPPDHQQLHTQLFTAIDAYLNQKAAAAPHTDPDTDPDIPPTTDLHTDPDTDPDIRTSNKLFWQTGPKKQRRKITARKRKFEENFQPWRRHSMIGNMKTDPLTLSKVPELTRKNTFEEAILDQGIEDEKENKLATQILENVELMNAVLHENADDDFDCKLSDLKNVEAMQLDITRRKGDRLIDCLGIIVNTINQLCDHVQHANNFK